MLPGSELRDGRCIAGVRISPSISLLSQVQQLGLDRDRCCMWERFVFDPARRNGFIARCRTAGPEARAVCHRAVVLSSGLELRYRFSQSLLDDWRRIDNAIVRKVAGFRMH